MNPRALIWPLRTTLGEKPAADPSLTCLPSAQSVRFALPSSLHVTCPPTLGPTQQFWVFHSQVTADLSMSHSHIGLNQDRESYSNS